MSLVSLQINDGVGLIRLNNPPTNLLSADLRRGLWEAIAICESEPQVTAVVLMGAGAVFCAGRDLGEGQDPEQGEGEAPDLAALCDRVDTCSKPVIAAVHGQAFGAGLEIALAAHYRLSEPDALFGLPDISLGLIPSGGATQRLPRLIGARGALRMMLRGRPVAAPAAEKSGLISGRVQGNLQVAAIRLAQDLAKSGAGPRSSRDETVGLADPVAYQAELAEAENQIRHAPYLAPQRVIDCVAAAQVLPFEQGLAYEAEAQTELAGGAEARALSYLAGIEKLPQYRGEPAKISPIGIAGAGARGAPLVAAALMSGLEVRILEQDSTYLAEGVGRVHALLHKAQEAGRLTPEGRAKVEARLTGATSIEDLGRVNFMVETLPDDAGHKPKLLAGLAEIVGPFGVVATLAESPHLGDLSTNSATDERLIGLRFVGPAHQSRLLEVVATKTTAQEAAATGAALAAHMGMRALVGPVPLVPALSRVLHRTVRQLAQTPEAQGRLAGAMARIGFGFAPVEVSPIAITSGEEAERLVRPVILALANFGARALEDGTAIGPWQVDMAAVSGLAFPRAKGGPMHWAGGQGLLRCRDELQELEGQFGDALFAPSHLFTDLGREVGSFDGWPLAG